MGAKVREDISALIEKLGHSDKNVQDASAQALIEAGDPAVELLAEHLTFTKEKSDACNRVADILSKIGTQKVVDLLSKKLMDYDWRVRTGAALALKNIGDSRVIDPLLEIFFKDSSRDHREYAEVVLWEIGSPVVERLIQALEDPEPDIRVRAARLLGKIKDARAVGPLNRVLAKDGNLDVQMVARRALESLRSE
jgi:HEAT repeat protein